MTEFENQVAIVTSAETGIGRSAALLYAQRGAKVIVSNVTEASGHEIVQTIKAIGGEAKFIRADVTVPADCENLISQTMDTYGRLDIAFNDARPGGDSAPIADYGVEALQKAFNISLSSLFYCMKYEIQAMLKNGRGSIVNMSSILGQVGSGMAPAYVAAKHGVVGWTQTAAADAGRRDDDAHSAQHNHPDPQERSVQHGGGRPPAVDIHVLQGERPMAADNTTLGKYARKSQTCSRR